MIYRNTLAFAVGGIVALGLISSPAAAQVSTGIAELLEEALTTSPELAAAERLAEAAAARIPQAGALPDPVLSLGVMNLPLDGLSLRQDGMTMGLFQLGQRLPAPGTRKQRAAIATHRYEAAKRDAEEVAQGVLTRLKLAYFELLFVDRAVDILTRNRALLVDLADVATSRFAVGRTPQQDVLRAQTEVTRLDEQVAGVDARRFAAAAEINAILLRPATAPLVPEYPESVRALALLAPQPGAFTAAALDGELGEGLPSLPELQEQAVRSRPMLLAHEHRIEASRDIVRLAERERFPDIDVMVGYGTRWDRSDMISATIAVPLPVFAERRQDQAVVEAQRELAAEELGHHAMVAEVRADVATRYAALVRTREQILLLNEGVLPQARATIESATAAYQAGSVEFASLLEAQATLFRNEMELARRMADFGRELAALERAAGVELTLGGDR